MRLSREGKYCQYEDARKSNRRVGAEGAFSGGEMIDNINIEEVEKTAKAGIDMGYPWKIILRLCKELREAREERDKWVGLYKVEMAEGLENKIPEVK